MASLGAEWHAARALLFSFSEALDQRPMLLTVLRSGSAPRKVMVYRAKVSRKKSFFDAALSFEQILAVSTAYQDEDLLISCNSLRW